MELLDIRTCCGYDPRNLVTKYRRRGDNIVSSKQQVGVAQPRRLHIDENFASYRRGDLNVLEIESSAECINYKCLHLPSLHTVSASGRAVISCCVVLSARNRCTRWTAIAPSPTADATRLTLPARVSPTANIPGTLGSSMTAAPLNSHLVFFYPTTSRPVTTNPLFSS